MAAALCWLAMAQAALSARIQEHCAHGGTLSFHPGEATQPGERFCWGELLPRALWISIPKMGKNK